MKLAKSPLIGERSGKRIGKTLNIVVKDVKEINMKKKHNLIDLLSSNNKIMIMYIFLMNLFFLKIKKMFSSISKKIKQG